MSSVKANQNKGKKATTAVLDEAIQKSSSLILRPPPCIISHGQEFIRKVLIKPSALKVYTVDFGCSVSRSLCSSFVSSSLLGTALSAELTAAATLTASAQAQALGLLALRIPLRAAGTIVGNGPTMTHLIELVTEYAARNAGAISQMNKMSTASQIATVGVKGNLLGALATAAVQESIAVAYYCHGGGTFDVLAHQTATIGLGAVSTVGGGTVGAAVGCLVLPGAGTAIGSLVGSYLGSFIPFYSRGNGYRHQTNEDPNMPSRKVKAVDVTPYSSRAFKGDTVPTSGGWLEVVDCSTESYFRFGEDGVGARAQDSLAMLREVSDEMSSGAFSNTPSHTSMGSSAMCGFSHSKSAQKPTASSAGFQDQTVPPGSSWRSFLSPSYLLGYGNEVANNDASAASASAGQPADLVSNSMLSACSSFFVSTAADVAPPKDDEMIIYFKPLEGAAEETALNEFNRTFASCVSFSD